MSALVSVQLGAEPRSGLGDAYAVEVRKLSLALSTRVLAVAVLLAPFVFAALLKVQSGTPADALFGAYVHTSGFAVSLVTLGFAGAWGFPVIAGLIGGDLFACEDRHGTWKTILTRSCTREEVVGAKLLAAGTIAAAISLLLALASVIAGTALVGAHALVNLSGELTSPGRMLALTAVSWLYCVLPMLAYTSVAILVSALTRNGILGVLSPLALALVTQLLDLVGHGVAMHALLIGTAFDAWHGLMVSHPFLGPLLLSAVVCTIWIAACLSVTGRVLTRRDFVALGHAERPQWRVALRLVAVAIAAVALLAVGASAGPAGVTATRLSAAIGPTFNNVTLRQQALIGRQAPPGARLDILPNCNRRGATSIGPGDWNCTLYVYLPQPNAVPFQQTQVDYEVSVQYNGCYKAQSPPAFIGGPTMRDAGGHSVANPLFIVYGCFNVL